MFVLETLLTVLTSSGNNLTHSTRMEVDSAACPSYINVRHELCATPDCKYPKLLQEKLLPQGSCSQNQSIVNTACITRECIRTAAQIINNIDERINPCDDFYYFACGSFIARTNTPLKSHIGYFSRTDKTVGAQVEELVSKPIRRKDKRYSKLAKTLYKACLNTTAIAARGYEPLQQTLDEFGGWPVIDGIYWDDSKFDWQKFVMLCRTKGYSINYLLTLDYINYPTFRSSRYLHLTHPELEWQPRVLMRGLRDPEVQVIFQKMLSTAYGMNPSSFNISKEIEDALNFQSDLARAVVSANYKLEPLTTFQLDTLFPTIPWALYINTLLKPNYVWAPSKPLMVNREYIGSLLDLLNKTPKRTVANYLVWRIVKDTMQLMPYRGFETLRAATCSEFTSKTMPLAVAAMYVEHYHNEGDREALMEMINNIKAELRKYITQVTWLGIKARDVLLHNLDTVQMRLAYPHDLMVDQRFEDLYYELHMSVDKFYESVLNNTVFETNYLMRLPWETLNQTVCHPKFGSFELLKAAAQYWMCGDNIIEIQAPMLLAEMFTTKRPNYLNYGYLGFIVGHEFSHVFEMLTYESLWTQKSYQEYRHRMQCLDDQYDSYYILGMQVRAVLTGNENLADLNGMKVSYEAYETWVKDNYIEKPLLGLENYTPKQLFWISAAMPWCMMYSFGSLQSLIRTDEHAPARFRMNGAMTNLKQFAADFNCPAGSRMNPTTKCSHVWTT